MLKPSISCDKPWGLLDRALTAMSSAANPKPKCSMPDATSTEAYARRWQALLAESSALHKEHMDLISSWTPPFSAQQTAQLEFQAPLAATRSTSSSPNSWTSGPMLGRHVPTCRTPFSFGTRPLLS